jgi:hypothetical protein
MLRALRVSAPDVKYQTLPSWATPTGVTCGEPPELIVVSHTVCRFGPPVRPVNSSPLDNAAAVGDR